LLAETLKTVENSLLALNRCDTSDLEIFRMSDDNIITGKRGKTLNRFTSTASAQASVWWSSFFLTRRCNKLFAFSERLLVKLTRVIW
jgi:hypothetical protein